MCLPPPHFDHLQSCTIPQHVHHVGPGSECGVVVMLCFRHNERARIFLGLLRQSQMYEVFVQERLALVGNTPGGPQQSGKQLA